MRQISKIFLMVAASAFLFSGFSLNSHPAKAELSDTEIQEIQVYGNKYGIEQIGLSEIILTWKDVKKYVPEDITSDNAETLNAEDAFKKVEEMMLEQGELYQKNITALSNLLTQYDEGTETLEEKEFYIADHMRMDGYEGLILDNPHHGKEIAQLQIDFYKLVALEILRDNLKMKIKPAEEQE